MELNRKQKIFIFLWSIFNKKKYKEYDKWLKAGMNFRSAYNTVNR
jgi:hypothetical protein